MGSAHTGEKIPSKAVVKRCDTSDEYYTREGCYIIELSNSEDDPVLSIARVRVRPGVTTRMHRLGRTFERYVILEGKGRVEAGSLSREISAGDVVLIPPMCPQRITNTGTSDLVFLAICTPRFSENAYEDVDGDRPSI